MFDASPIASVAIAATSAVDVSSAPNICGPPAAPCRISGFTNRMYAIVTNVVAPARISRRTVVPRAVRPKKRSRAPAGAAGAGVGVMSYLLAVRDDLPAFVAGRSSCTTRSAP